MIFSGILKGSSAQTPWPRVETVFSDEGAPATDKEFSNDLAERELADLEKEVNYTLRAGVRKEVVNALLKR